MTSMVPNVPLPAVQLTSLLEHIPMGVFMIDADFRMAYVNKAASPVFDNIVGGVIGRDFDELIHVMRDPYYADAVIRVFRNTLTTGESYATAETSTAPGRPVGELYEWRVERVLMDDGRFGLAGFFRDITKEVYQHQLDTFRVALTDTLRPAASAADVQAAAAKLLGDQLVLGAVLYAEVVSRADSDYYIVQQYYRAEGSGDFNGEYRANDFGEVLFEEMRAGHTVVTNNVATEARLSPAEKQAHAALRVGSYIKVPLIKEGRHVALISIHQEQPRVWTPVEVALVEETAERTWAAAERARAEAKIGEGQVDSARQRRLYEAVLSNTPDLAYVWNREHRFIYANEGLLKMWGKTLDEAIGKHCIELGYEPWHAQMHDREIDQVVATKRPMRGEVPFVGTFGRRVYDYILVPVFGPDGEVEAVAGTTRDVTEIKESERRKDEFLATLAHELRNPLAPIRNSIHALSLNAKGNAAISQVCDMVERQVSHMVRLVDDLMEISRISRGVIELRRALTTLDTIVRSAVDTSTPLIVAAKHTLIVELPPESISLYGDGVRLAQVIANVLNNAAKYTDHGGHILLRAELEGPELVIRVRDNGIGIAANMLPLIFDMFVQVKNASSHTHGGLGIGLSLVKHLVEMHGGSLSATSAGAGLGSEFCIRLPCVVQQTDTSVPSPEGSELPEVKKRVLIVDDNEDAASSLALLIVRLGSEVQVANNGADALALMNSFRPDVALLDLGMPGITGFDIATQAKRTASMEHIKLIALTGWGQPEDRERTRAAGFDYHLVKPAALSELQKLLSSLA